MPVVLNRDEIQAILMRLSGTPHLIASLLYGTGMRIMECLRLRVQDVDFKRREILIRDGKGAKDRVTVLPASLTPALQAHLSKVRDLHVTDLAQGYGAVNLPNALACKYPSAAREWIWQYVFPAARLSTDPRSG